MSEEQEIRPGFLPPRPPVSPPPVEPPPTFERPTFVAPASAAGPSSPMAVIAIVLGALAMAILVVSVGVGYTLSAILSGIALAMGLTVRRRIASGVPGRPGQARAAIVVALIALGLTAVAAIVWIALESSGFTPQDLERWLQDELERRQDGGGPPGDPA